MTTIVDGFEHRAGAHCGSTAMSDLFRHRGRDISEAMALGLGSGLAFYYLRVDGMSPSRQIMGRSASLEFDAASALGYDLVDRSFDDRDAAEQFVRDAIHDDVPVLISCDLAELPYWNSSTPFNGHRVVAAGWDDEAGEVLLGDTHYEELQRVRLDAFDAARASTAPPTFATGRVCWTLEGEGDVAIADAIDPALEKLRTNLEDDGGLEQLRAFADDVASWRELDDAVWCYRFAYQVIERRGTGGGFFRRLARDFLREARDHDSTLGFQLGIGMAKSAEAWSTLSDYLLAASEALDPESTDPREDPFHHVESLAEAVYQYETAFCDLVSYR